MNGEELVLRNLNFRCTLKFKSDRKISRWREIFLASPREAIASATSLKGVSHCAPLRFLFEKSNNRLARVNLLKKIFRFSILPLSLLGLASKLSKGLI